MAGFLFFLGLAVMVGGYVAIKKSNSNSTTLAGILLLIGGLLIMGASVRSCSDDDEDSYEYSSPNSSPSFKGSPKYYKLEDKNKLCPTKKGHFVIVKTNEIINSADRCDNCGHAWYVHKDK